LQIKTAISHLSIPWQNWNNKRPSNVPSVVIKCTQTQHPNTTRSPTIISIRHVTVVHSNIIM
jgi:hypothetical protein